MPFVAIDSNIPDEIVQALDVGPGLTDGMEALRPPPAILTPRGYTWYWLLALAPYWRSCLYTFSDTLCDEVTRIPPTKGYWRLRLLSLAAEIRKAHPEDARVPQPAVRSARSELTGIGLGRMDADHVADAIGLGCSHLLTRDKGILKRASRIRSRYGLSMLTPDEFLLASVRAGAPWPTAVTWPWESGPLADEPAG